MVELGSVVLTATVVVGALIGSDLATRIAQGGIAVLVHLIAGVSACRRRVDVQAHRRAVAACTYRGATGFLAVVTGVAAAGGGHGVLAAVAGALIGAVGPVVIALAIDSYVDCQRGAP